MSHPVDRRWIVRGSIRILRLSFLPTGIATADAEPALLAQVIPRGADADKRRVDQSNALGNSF